MIVITLQPYKPMSLLFMLVYLKEPYVAFDLLNFRTKLILPGTELAAVILATPALYTTHRKFYHGIIAIVFYYSMYAMVLFDSTIMHPMVCTVVHYIWRLYDDV